jgi:hypothetical protein
VETLLAIIARDRRRFGSFSKVITDDQFTHCAKVTDDLVNLLKLLSWNIREYIFPSSPPSYGHGSGLGRQSMKASGWTR